MSAPRPYNLIAELTYRCPLRCVYCSNPLGYRAVRDALDGAAWSRVFGEAAALGAVHVGLTGGEPTLHPDLEADRRGRDARLALFAPRDGGHHARPRPDSPRSRARGCAACSSRSRMRTPPRRTRSRERSASTRSSRSRPRCASSRLPLTLNVVLHRHNLARVAEIIALAQRLGAARLELANAQYQGWALRNRAALLPTRAQLDARRARGGAAAPRDARASRSCSCCPTITATARSRAWADGGGRVSSSRPTGACCRATAPPSCPGSSSGACRERSLADCWSDAPGMNAFRGEAWMPAPCRDCPERTRDFGGCRCQAFALTGDAAATDPACSLAPAHEVDPARARRGGSRATRELRLSRI